MRKMGYCLALLCVLLCMAFSAAAEIKLPRFVAPQGQAGVRTETSQSGDNLAVTVSADDVLQVIGYSYDMEGNLWWRMVDYRTGKDGYGIADSFAEVTDEEAQLRKVQIDTATPTPTPTSTPTPTPMPTPTPTATPTHTPTPTPVSTTIPTPVPSREPTASPTPCLVLADTNEVYVEFRGIVPDDHGDIVNLYIENKRNESIWVSLSSVSINSKKIIIYNGLVSVAAGSKYQAAPSHHFLISREQYEQHGIASTDELEFDLLVYDGKVLSVVVFNMRAKLNLKVESLAAIEPTATPAPIQNVKIEGYPYVGWTLKAANVRKSPSSKADRVGETKKGEEVAVLGEKTDSNGTIWYEVSSLFGGKGYVRSDLIQVQKEADVSAIYHQADPAPVTESAPISLSFEEIRTAFKQNMDDTPAWNIQEITQVDENCWMFEAVYSSDPNKNRMQVYYRITENGQIVIGARTNADAAGSYEELLKTAKRIHDGGDYGWYLTDADFDYNSLANLCSRLLKVFTSDFDFGLVGEKEYNFFERAIAVGYEDNFAYGFDSDHFADGYGDQFTRVGDYEICFSIRDMQLELAIRKRKSGPGAGKANSVSILELETYSSEPKDEYPKTGTITGSNVNIRQEPDTGSKRIAKYQHGTIVTVLGEEKRGEYTWYRIVVSGGDSGYVRGDLLELGSGQTTAVADSTSTANAGKQSTTKKNTSSTGSTTKKSTSSSKAKSCSTCGGDGKVTSNCSSCDGKGKYYVNCDSCGGDGKKSCYKCSGYGKLKCGTCKSGRIKCHSCGGDGYNGSKHYNSGLCRTCKGSGVRNCDVCDGTSYRKCLPCGGYGWERCRICSASAGRYKVKCSACSGSGKITKNCPTCR